MDKDEIIIRIVEIFREFKNEENLSTFLENLFNDETKPSEFKKIWWKIANEEMSISLNHQFKMNELLKSLRRF